MKSRFKAFTGKKELSPDHKDVKLEKNDFLAMMIAIFWTLFPVVAVIFIFFALIIIFLF